MLQTGWQFTPLILPVLLTVVMSVWIAAYSYRHRSSPVASALMWGTVAIGIWALTRLFSLAALSPDAKFWWGKAEYFGIVSVPLTTLFFGLQYTGRGRWVTWRTIGLASILPLITLALIWTTEWHGLMWEEKFIEQTPWGTVFYTTLGDWFAVHTAYSYLLCGLGSLLIFEQLWRCPPHYRRQAIVLIVAILTPLSANIGYLAGMQPAWLDLTPSAFAVSMGSFALDIYRFQLLNVLPIARRLIFDRLGDGLIVLNADDRIADINPAAASFFSLKSNIGLGEQLSHTLAHSQSFVDLFYASAGREFEWQVARNGESVRWFQVQTTVIELSKSATSGRVILLHEITAQKLNEQTLKTLATARDAALLADQFKTQLLTKVSHELRTPLSVILTYTELLQRNMTNATSEKQARAITTIISNARHLNKLVSDLLDAAQLDADQLKLHNVLFSPQNLVEQVYLPALIVAEAKGISLTYSIANDLPTNLWGDVDRLHQTLLNLVNNAIKFTTSGSVTIRLICYGSERWAMSITDSGIGIPVEMQPSIFEPFQQLVTSTASKKEGYGLGLAIVQQLVHLMQGEVVLESTPGVGSTFRVILPLQVLPQPASGYEETKG